MASSSIDRARDEVERIAREMRENVYSTTGSWAPPPPPQKLPQVEMLKAIGPYPQRINQIRTAELVALVVQLLTLYLESNNTGFGSCLLALLCIIVNLVLTGKRYYKRIDGRYDAQQLISVQDTSVKAQYGLVLFGGLLLAILTHFLSPTFQHSGVGSVLFKLADYTSIIAFLIAVLFELYEGVRAKLS